MKMTARVKEIAKEAPILKSLVVRNLKDRYGATALGFLWAVVNPCLMALVITFVFSFVMRAEIKNFPLFILSGILPWFFFSNSFSESASALRQNQEILNKFAMAKEIVPLSVAMSNFLHLMVGLAVITPFFVFFNPAVAPGLLLLPVALLFFFLFTLGACLGLSILAVYSRDISVFLNVGTMFLFWVTPVFYDTSVIPSRYHWIIQCNPLSSFIRIFQALLYEGSFGNPYWWGVSFFLAVVALAAGYAVFTWKENEILKYL